MAHRRLAFRLAPGLVVVGFAGCTWGGDDREESTPDEAVPVPSRLRDAYRACPVTIPDNPAGRYGNEALTTALSARGLVVAVARGRAQAGDAIVLDSVRRDGSARNGGADAAASGDALTSTGRTHVRVGNGTSVMHLWP